jgi:hypothetical protein
MIVAGVCPSAGTVDGLALIPALAAAGTTKVKLAVGSTRPSVVSVAVKIRGSAVKSVTVNATAPSLTVVTPLAGVITALALFALRVTVLPLTMFPFAS